MTREYFAVVTPSEKREIKGNIRVGHVQERGDSYHIDNKHYTLL